MKIYIASPYSIGDVGKNVRTQIEAANKLMDMGHNPFVPLLAHFQHVVLPRTYEDWLRHDLVWLPCCDCVLRLPGESNGADIEVQKAKELGIKVYYSIEEILENT